MVARRGARLLRSRTPGVGWHAFLENFSLDELARVRQIVGKDPIKLGKVSRTHEIWATMASATGLPFKEVSEIGRRIREHGLFSRHTRAKESQVITDTDLANLTIAVMSGLPAQHTHIAVRRLSDAGVFSGDHKHILQARHVFEELGDPITVFLDPQHTYAEALAALYRLARLRPALFEQEWRFTSVTLDQKNFGGEISLWAESFQPGPLPRTVLDQTIGYSPAEGFFHGDLEICAKLPASTILAVARAADRVTP
jgi:hypothetical protein